MDMYEPQRISMTSCFDRRLSQRDWNLWRMPSSAINMYWNSSMTMTFLPGRRERYIVNADSQSGNSAGGRPSFLQTAIENAGSSICLLDSSTS